MASCMQKGYHQRNTAPLSLNDLGFYRLTTPIKEAFTGPAMAGHRIPCRSSVSRSLRLPLDTVSLAWFGKSAPSLSKKHSCFCWGIIDASGENEPSSNRLFSSTPGSAFHRIARNE